jgi:hypothetical protein
LKPVVMRGSRNTNLRMLSKSLIPVGPSRLWRWDEHFGEIDPLYLSAINPVVSVRRLDLSGDSKSGKSLVSHRLSLSGRFALYRLLRYWLIMTVTVTSMREKVR